MSFDAIALVPEGGMPRHLHLSKQCFEVDGQKLDCSQLVGKPFRAGLRRWEIEAVEEHPDCVVLTIGKELPGVHGP